MKFPNLADFRANLYNPYSIDNTRAEIFDFLSYMGECCNEFIEAKLIYDTLGLDPKEGWVALRQMVKDETIVMQKSDTMVLCDDGIKRKMNEYRIPTLKDKILLKRKKERKKLNVNSYAKYDTRGS
jgi:hypothetical protein